MKWWDIAQKMGMTRTSNFEIRMSLILKLNRN
jgi:hypothetical protein